MQTEFRRIDERQFIGFAYNRANLYQKFAVEILVDGCPVKLVRADAPARGLIRQGVGDGCYGFVASLDEKLIRDSGCVEARLANLGAAVGAPLMLDASHGEDAEPSGPGEVRWLGGLRFSGWIGDLAEAALCADVDGVLIARIGASGWRHVGPAENARPARGFDFHLPSRFADGAVHRLALLTERGEALAGSPISFLAYPRGFADAAGHDGASRPDPALEYLDRLMPISAPFSHYGAWREQVSLTAGQSLATPIAVFMIGCGAMEDSIESLEAQSHHDWVAIELPRAGGGARFQPAAVRNLLRTEAAECEIVVCGLAGTSLEPNALQRLANVFADHRQAVLAYGDLEIRGANSATWPLTLPAFDYERMLEQGYCALFFAARRECFERALSSGASNLFRLFNVALDADGARHQDIVHLPGALAALPPFHAAAFSDDLAQASREHLRRRGFRASAERARGGSLPAARIARSFDPIRTSIIIPTRNRADLLRACLSSIAPALAKASAELLVVDNDSHEPDALECLAEIKARGGRVVHVPGAFNYAALMNRAVETATGEALCLLNNDVKALDESWLDEMLGRLADPDVGAVGALLVWPSGVVQHGGVVLGPSFAAAHAFNDRLASDGGYADLLRVAHECSAATAACLVARRRDYFEVGGMDATQFPINFNDVDFCLKLRAKGKRIVFTPHAKLEHLESASRGRIQGADRAALFERELRLLRAKWGAVLSADPYYSPLLSLDPIPYSALAWPVRALAPRMNTPPIANDAPPGF